MTDKAKTIAIINPKGGSGKSTLSHNLASALAKLGYKTGLIDFDHQASITDKFHNYFEGQEREEEYNKSRGLSDYLIEAKPLELSDFFEIKENLYFIGNAKDVDNDFFTQKNIQSIKYKVFKKLISKIDYLDYIIVDTTGTQEVQFYNALNGCNYALISAFYNPENKFPIVEAVQSIKTFQEDEERNPELRFLGLVMNKVDSREKTMVDDFVNFIEEVGVKDKLFNQRIRKSLNVSKIYDKGLDVFQANLEGISQDYELLAKEVSTRIDDM